MPVHRTCYRCGRHFQVPPSFSNPKRTYCSVACRRVREPTPCPVCGAMFRNSHGEIRTCSKPCGYELKFRSYMARAEARIGEPIGEAIRRRLDDGQSVRDVVRALGLADNRQLHRIMARLGIPIPTRSEAVRKQWLNNPERRAKQAAFLTGYVRADPERARRNSIAGNVKLQTTRPTSIERRLMAALDAAGIAYEFQYVVGEKFLCDFAFPDSRLIVEADGSYWHRTPRQKKQDASKDAYLRACGFAVLRLTDVEITQHLTESLRRIQALLHSK